MTTKLPLALSNFSRFLEQFAESYLRPYLDRLDAVPSSNRVKEFNDPVWGTIPLTNVEVLILDSPLLQRLRRIRQLGVAHWVYPGANHTRLEHSIGALYQLSRLIDAINSSSTDPVITPDWRNLLRLTALCHDVGHGMMSHVSENALSDFDVVDDIRIEFQKAHSSEKKTLSEIAAFYIIRSNAFRELLARADFTSYILPSDAPAPDLMSRMIIGLPVTDRMPLLQELISGPFDADKLDYMTRDAQMSEVPVVTDIPRLIQKVRALSVPQEKLPREIARQVKGGEASYLITGIQLSGGRTLDELMLGRTLLFDKIYRHHKVRAIESMIAAIFGELGNLVDGPETLPYWLVDEQLIDLDRATIERQLRRELSAPEGKHADIATDLARRLRDRDLFSRAFAFSQAMPLDPYGGDSKQKVGLDRLLRAVADASERRFLAGRIADEAMVIIHRLGATDRLSGLSEARIASYVRIDAPAPPGQSGEISRAYLITEDGQIRRFRDESAESRGWSDAYLLTRDIGYIFCPRSISPYVFLAAERIVRKEYEVRIPGSMYPYAKQYRANLEELRRKLDVAGYYDNAPSDLRPLPPRLTRADIDGRVAQIVQRLAGFEGLAPSAGEEGKNRVEKGRVIDWLRQFETDDLIESALCTLEGIRWIGRDEVVSALREFLSNAEEFQSGAIVSPLGGLGDSSSHVSYYAVDLKPEFNLRVGGLQECRREDLIIFLDDFLGSGGQAVSIVENWLGEERSVELDEDRPALTPDLQELLKSRRLAFVFAAGTESGRERLEKRLSELGLTARVHIRSTEALPRASDSAVIETDDSRKAFIEACRAIGEQLLSDGDDKHTLQWCADRALGYGNDAYLLVFPYNVPTQTLTCLWASGHVNGRPWQPLLPRRKKV